MNLNKEELLQLVKSSYEEGWIDSHHDCINGEGISQADDDSWLYSNSFEKLQAFNKE